MLRESSVEVVEVAKSWASVSGVANANASCQSRDRQCEQVHRRLKRIVKARGALDMQEAAALREADALRVWRHFGYSSLVEYMEMEMGYTPRAAIERLRVAKAIEELPLIADAMEQGDLSFSAARELTRVATPETETQWLEASNEKNLRQVEELVSGHKQGDKPSDPVDPKLRKKTLRYDEIDPETVALIREAKLILERECGDRLDDNAFLRSLARMVIEGGAATERTRAPYQIAIIVCEQCRRGWQNGSGLSVEMSPAALEVALCDAQHIGRVDVDETASRAGDIDIGETAADTGDIDNGETAAHARDIDTTRVNKGHVPASRPHVKQRAKHDIPPALRRKVKARDKGTCRVPWCRSSRNCDQHHIIPVSQGGQHTLENLITLCESHHIAHHEGGLLIRGPASKVTFERRGQNALAREAHAVDTAKALRAAGFGRHEVNEAIERTRTHVGTSALSLEQWIKIALGYCPRPRA